LKGVEFEPSHYSRKGSLRSRLLGGSVSTGVRFVVGEHRTMRPDVTVSPPDLHQDGHRNWMLGRVRNWNVY
jgi:hypothetical protein